MSNSQYTFSALLNIIKNRPGGPGNLFFVNGAQGGMDARHWANPSDPCWGVLAQDRFALEAQILLIELTERAPQQYGGFPAHAQQLASDVKATIANAAKLMPNLKLVDLESVNHTFTTSLTSIQPEPYAFEGAYGMRLAVGANTQPFPVVWGPYLWADSDPRLYDGFNFPQSDVLSDNVHPSPAGAQALGKMMDNWFKADPSCSPWYSGRAKNPQGGIVVNPAATSQFAVTGWPANYTFTTTDSASVTVSPGGALPLALSASISVGRSKISMVPTQAWFAGGVVRSGGVGGKATSSTGAAAIDNYFRHVAGRTLPAGELDLIADLFGEQETA
jgi:hypothetical protein